MNIINYEKINLDTDYETELCDSFTITEEQALYLISHDKADAFNWLFSKEQIFDEFENFSDYEKQYAKENNANWYMCKDGDITPVWYLTDFWEFYNSDKLSEFDIKWKMLQKFNHWMREDKFDWRILNKQPNNYDEYIDVQNIKTLDVYRYEQTSQTDYAIIWTCLYNEFKQEVKKNGFKHNYLIRFAQNDLCYLFVLPAFQTVAKIYNSNCMEFYRGMYWDVYDSICT